MTYWSVHMCIHGDPWQDPRGNANDTLLTTMGY